MNQNTTVEIWKDIKGYEGHYQASCLGRIRSIKSKKIMSVKKQSRGYPQINFCKNGVRKILYIHRIIAETFIQNSNGYKTVDHIDEDKTNNTSINLQWCSQNKNMILFHKRRQQKNRMQKHMRLSAKDVIHIRDEHQKYEINAKTLAHGYKVSMSLIYKILGSELWKNL